MGQGYLLALPHQRPRIPTGRGRRLKISTVRVRIPARLPFLFIGVCMDIPKAILLVTWAGTVHLAKQLLETSLKDSKWPIVVVISEAEATTDGESMRWLIDNYRTIPVEGNRWEVGGLEAMLIFTTYEEWVLIQDTLEIKDASIFDIMFDEKYDGKSLAFGPNWLCYLGKYRRQILTQFPVPVCLNKMDAFYYEHFLPRMYDTVAKVLEGQPAEVLFPEWGNTNPNNTMDEKFGRKNLVLDNPYLIKRKSLEWKWSKIKALPELDTIAYIDHM